MFAGCLPCRAPDIDYELDDAEPNFAARVEDDFQISMVEVRPRSLYLSFRLPVSNLYCLGLAPTSGIDMRGSPAEDEYEASPANDERTAEEMLAQLDGERITKNMLCMEVAQTTATTQALECIVQVRGPDSDVNGIIEEFVPDALGGDLVRHAVRHLQPGTAYVVRVGVRISRAEEIFSPGISVRTPWLALPIEGSFLDGLDIILPEMSGDGVAKESASSSASTSSTSAASASTHYRKESLSTAKASFLPTSLEEAMLDSFIWSIETDEEEPMACHPLPAPAESKSPGRQTGPMPTTVPSLLIPSAVVVARGLQAQPSTDICKFGPLDFTTVLDCCHQSSKFRGDAKDKPKSSAFTAASDVVEPVETMALAPRAESRQHAAPRSRKPRRAAFPGVAVDPASVGLTHVQDRADAIDRILKEGTREWIHPGEMYL